KGERWLDRLPEFIRTLEGRWAITAGKHFPNIGYNYVAAAIRDDGTSAVFKIGLPLENVEINSEEKYLKTLGGRGAVKLLNEDRQIQALLLERALPGKNLTHVFQGLEPEAIEPAIEVLRTIRRKPPVDLSD